MCCCVFLCVFVCFCVLLCVVVCCCVLLCVVVCYARRQREDQTVVARSPCIFPLPARNLRQRCRPPTTQLRHARVVTWRHREVLRAGGGRSLLALGVVPLVTLLPPGSLDADRRLGLPSIPTTMRGDPHRVKTQVEPDPSLSPQAPFRRRTIAR